LSQTPDEAAPAEHPPETADAGGDAEQASSPGEEPAPEGEADAPIPQALPDDSVRLGAPALPSAGEDIVDAAPDWNVPRRRHGGAMPV
jgi:hypothetical protein